MGCSKEAIICHIIRQLSSYSPCAVTLCDTVPALWDLVSCESGGSCQLAALLTKREAILYLLGCEAYSVDQAESHYMMTADAKADSRADSRTQAQSTGSSNRNMDAHGETQYSERSEASSIYNSKRLGRAKENSDGSSFYRDDGKGYGYNRSNSFSFLQNRIDHDAIRSNGTSGAEHDRKTDCNYEYSRNATSGSGLFAVVIGGAFSGTASEWRKFQRTTAYGINETAGSSFADGTENDTGLSSSHGEHYWEDTFIADIEWYEKEHIIRFHNERFDSKKTALAHSDGSGDGIHEQKDESHSASQGTSQTIADSETLRIASRVSNLSAFDIANSQRFTNLQNLYDQLTEQISHLRKRLRGTAQPYIDVIPCCCVSKCCCGPQLRKRGLDAMSNCGAKTCASGPSMLWNTGAM